MILRKIVVVYCLLLGVEGFVYFSPTTHGRLSKKTLDVDQSRKIVPGNRFLTLTLMRNQLQRQTTGYFTILSILVSNLSGGTSTSFKTRIKENVRTKLIEKIQTPWRLILHDDDNNTIEEVQECLPEVKFYAVWKC